MQAAKPLPLRILAWLLPMLSLLACLTPPKLYQDIDCPVPVRECRAGHWHGSVLDTSSSQSIESNYYLRIEPLSGINSPQDEFALHFAAGDKPVLTSADATGDQRLTSILLQSAARGSRQRSISLRDFSQYGGVSRYEQLFVFSGVPDDAITGDAGLYSATLRDGSLDEVQALDRHINLDVVWDSHPALTPDGQALFFSSERPGGLGGTDIWYCLRLPDGRWSQARNCGPAINTRCDELSPFVTVDGATLLFASSGHATVGGYDLFAALLRPGYREAETTREAFSAARNLGAPINTPADELFPASPAHYDTLLYYASNQPAPAGLRASERGRFDIYVLHPVKRRRTQLADLEREVPRIELPNRRIAALELETDPPTKANPEPVTPVLIISGQVLDRYSRQPIPAALVTLRDAERQTILDSATSDPDGHFSLKAKKGLELAISAEAPDRFPDSYKVYFPAKDTTSEYRRNLELARNLTLRLNFPNDIYRSPYPYVLDSNGVETKQTWQEAVGLIAGHLGFYASEIKKVILIGHTDEKASEQYNLMLGQRRAEFVKRELVRRGIPAAKLEIQSAGETLPLQRRPGEDLETFYVRCRRVELVKILEE